MHSDTLTDSIGVLILAAGGSHRLGTPKQLLRDQNGLSLVRHAVQTALHSACRPITVVLGAASEAVAAEIADLPVTLTLNSEWQMGMASSLKIGLQSLSEASSLQAVIVMLCDQPQVSDSLLNSLSAAYRHTRDAIVACDYGATIGVPALFGHSLFATLNALTGEEGARRVLRQYPGPITTVPFPEGLLDVDTPQDAQRLWC